MRAKSVGGAAPASASRMASARPRRAVEYRDIVFTEKIGSGSFGSVWKGTHRGEAAAIKKCKVGSREEVSQLMREVRCLQSLRHLRIVSFMGCCELTHHILILMELMTGGSLNALLFGATARVLSCAQQQLMSQQIAEGLAYLHASNVVHRDLKTANIVLDAELNCKICDFGLTVSLEKTHLTVAGVQGSPRYMAPEQLLPPCCITEKVDLWAMGCVLLELFWRSVPFSHCKSVAQIATELLTLKRAPAIPAHAQPPAADAVRSCFHFEPQKRPTASALEVTLGTVLRQ